MISKIFTPQRYQITKHINHIIKSGHPWIYRTQLSSAINSFSDGQMLKLVDGKNKIIGYGVYSSTGLIGIRVLKKGETSPNLSWINSMVMKALEKRKNLMNYTNSVRIIHGENDGFPSIVIDLYGMNTLVLQTYSKSLNTWGRYISSLLSKKLKVPNVIWKNPIRSKEKRTFKVRVLRGILEDIVEVKEGKLIYYVQPKLGQKSGAFLDLRGLRKKLLNMNLAGARILNLFSYTGTLSLASEIGGAKEIWNLDISEEALKFGKKFHALKNAKIRWIKENIFKWIKNYANQEKFNVIISDPPSMAAKKSQVKKALIKYKSLYNKIKKQLSKDGLLIACCCTSRIERMVYKKQMIYILGKDFKLIEELLPEDDHPVKFLEGDYLKILIFRKLR